MLREPTITRLDVTGLVLFEVEPNSSSLLNDLARREPASVFLYAATATAVCLLFRDDSSRDAELELMSAREDDAHLRIAHDLVGLEIGVERLDREPGLPSRVASELAKNGYAVIHVIPEMNVLRIVLRGRTRSEAAAEVVRRTIHRPS